MPKYILLLFLLCSGGLSLCAQSTYPDLDHPPIKIPVYLSGNFGEIRGNHFHTGLDIKTRGSEGYNLYAVWPGTVSRIKVSPYGYGRALYIDHPNGYTTVYAHLKRFNDDVEAYIKSEQYRLKQYEVELFPPNGKFSFAASDIVALSGNSGSSQGPHLHFEIRETKTEKPVNPQLFNIELQDNVKPSIYGVKLEAKNSNSGVNGSAYDYFGMGGVHGDYILNTGEIKAYGELGIYLHSIDKYTGVPNSNGTYRIAFEVNDSLFYEMRLDKLDFSTNRFINNHIDYGLYQRNRKKYQKCFVEGYNLLDIFKNLSKDGKLIIEQGKKYDIKLYASDLKNNESVLNFSIIGDSTAVQPSEDAKGFAINYLKEKELNLPFAQITFPPKTFYTNQHIEINSEENDGFLSPIYTIGNDETPIHSYFDIVINKDLQSTKGLFLATLGNNNSVTGADFIKKTNEQGFWFKTRYLGKYALMQDTIAPKLSAPGYSFNKNYSNNQALRFTFVEQLTGLGSYNLFIDGKWALLEYDAKRKSFYYRCDNEKLETGLHKFELIVEDGVKNQATFSGQFKFI